ncbi:MAG: sulfatase-like hydrolase/transferase [Acidobacteria bacterium]|nr:sulfatase-like hydrolase/transferase [Acidobacteriota bacterium]MBI3470364.1 sulfatase-like hydrolase/transferase [Candidatus Solibacter usitatus]
MTRRQVLKLSAAGALGPLVLPAQAPPPNILMIYADDLGWSDVGFNGRRTWDTPHLDRLASQGVRFTRWYSGAVVCAPSRGCLLTGKYTIHNGLKTNGDDLPAGETTIAEALKRHGYSTALVGKWHRGKRPDGGFTHPLDQGFDQTFGFLDATEAHQHYPKTLFRNRERVPVSGYTADLFSEEAIRYLESPRRQPFFLYLAYIESHFRIEAPEEDVALYRGRFKEKDPANPLNARYAAMIHRMDSGIGRVLETLDDAGLAGNTLVVFSSDQGATFETGNQGVSNYHDSNYPFRGQKRSLEEGGIRVPAVVRWPGKTPAGAVSSAVIHMTDLFPTFVAAAGGAVDPAWKVDGMNMLDVFQGKSAPPDRTLFWEWSSEGGNMYAAMRGDWKLLVIGGAEFLYNVADDPGERRTLAGERPDILKQLRAELRAWQATEVKR